MEPLLNLLPFHGLSSVYLTRLLLLRKTIEEGMFCSWEGKAGIQILRKKENISGDIIMLLHSMIFKGHHNNDGEAVKPATTKNVAILYPREW